MKRTARELYELAMQNDSNTKSVMMFGHTSSEILEALELWEREQYNKGRKMTREEAVEKVSLNILQPNGFILAIEALGLIKFDEAKPIGSETTKHFIDRVKWRSKDGGVSWFHKDYDPNSINPGWTKVESHQELINEAERYLNYEYSEFEKNLFYPHIIEVIKRLVEVVKSKSVIGHKFEDKELIIENANSKHEAVRIRVARMKEVLEWRGYKVTKD